MDYCDWFAIDLICILFAFQLKLNKNIDPIYLLFMKIYSKYVNNNNTFSKALQKLKSKKQQVFYKP